MNIEATQTATLPNIDAARDFAVVLIEQGANMEQATRLAAMFGVFLDRNRDAMAGFVAAGESAEAIADEAIAAFMRSAAKSF